MQVQHPAPQRVHRHEHSPVDRPDLIVPALAQLLVVLGVGDTVDHQRPAAAHEVPAVVRSGLRLPARSRAESRVRDAEHAGHACFHVARGGVGVRVARRRVRRHSGHRRHGRSRRRVGLLGTHRAGCERCRDDNCGERPSKAGHLNRVEVAVRAQLMVREAPAPMTRHTRSRGQGECSRVWHARIREAS